MAKRLTKRNMRWEALDWNVHKQRNMQTNVPTRGQDIHTYETRGRANYRTRRHRLPNSIKHAPTPKALKTRLKRFLVSQAFYNAGEFLAFDWETAQLED
ncbi:hypothetical protein J6590_072046 [Homalodisca vitripennis]|nr:hypothetical protein J6590_072046 [Homalodisca vitripennis]